VDVKPDLKPRAKTTSETRSRVPGGRERDPDVGDLLSDLNLEGLDAAQMDDLGGVTGDILAAQMKILAEHKVSDSGEDTVGGDSEDEGSSKSKGTHNPGAPEFKTGACAVYLGQGGDEMRLGYVLEVYVDGGGGHLYYTANLEGIGEKQAEGHPLFPVTSDSQEKPSLPDPPKAPSKSSQESVHDINVRIGKKYAATTSGEQEIGEAFLFSKKKSLQLSLSLIQKQESAPVDLWDKFLATEVTGYYYAVAMVNSVDIFGINADVKKFLTEVNGVVGALFKVCESHSEARLYLEDHSTNGKGISLREGLLTRHTRWKPPPPTHPGMKKRDLFKASMLYLAG
jgi:hypothetical protein